MELKQFLKQQEPIYEHKSPLYEAIKKIAESNIKTTFIGAIATFEETFGFMWGHGKLHKTKEEEELFQLWQICRKQILDKGNNNIRLAKQSIDNIVPQSITFIQKG
jgi:hypothetical protein